MKNLIYQYWDTMGKKRVNLPGVKTSWENMKKYADRIGAEHLAETNPPHLHKLDCALYYGSFNPVFRKEFHEYDNVLFLDSDNHPVEGLEENIFEGFDSEIGIIHDPIVDQLRARTKIGKINRRQDDLWASQVEKRWDIKFPRTREGFVRHLNSGLILYSNQGMLKAKEKFIPFADYIPFVLSIKGLLPFYAADQNYLQTTLFASKMDFTELDPSWNVYVSTHEKNPKRIIFDRTDDAKIIHPFGLCGVHHYNRKRLWKLANLPVEQWGEGQRNVTGEVKELCGLS
jgi:hypothetical protein